MCAIVEEKEVKIVKAIEDIICYKYYMKADDGSLKAWFHGDMKYKVDESYTDKINFYNSKQLIEVIDGEIVESAQWKSQKGFHSAISLSSCIEMLENKAKPYMHNKIVICKCKIPQGSLYTIASEDHNSDYSNLDCYVSESIFIEKELFEIVGEDLNIKRKFYDIDSAW